VYYLSVASLTTQSNYNIPIEVVRILVSTDAVAVTDVSLAIRLKKLSEAFGFNSCNPWKGVMCKFSLHLFSLCTVKTVTHSYDTWTFMPQLYWLRVDRILDVIFQISTIFLRHFLCQISYSSFWVDISFEAIAQTVFDIRLRPIFLKFSSSFFL
jgi:hypothetical protein